MPTLDFVSAMRPLVDWDVRCSDSRPALREASSPVRFFHADACVVEVDVHICDDFASEALLTIGSRTMLLLQRVGRCGEAC